VERTTAAANKQRLVSSVSTHGHIGNYRVHTTKLFLRLAHHNVRPTDPNQCHATIMLRGPSLRFCVRVICSSSHIRYLYVIYDDLSRLKTTCSWKIQKANKITINVYFCLERALQSVYRSRLGLMER